MQGSVSQAIFPKSINENLRRENTVAEEIFAEVFYGRGERLLRVARRKPKFLFGFRRVEVPKILGLLDLFRCDGRCFPQFLNTESISEEPAMASFFGTLSIGAETPLRRSSRQKKSLNVMFATPSRYFS